MIHVYTKTMPQRFVLCDLDNCFSDDRWRTPMIDWHLDGNERYNRYDSQMHRDYPAHTVEWRMATALATPVFVTGRREKWRTKTRDWIIKNLPLWREGGLAWQTDPLIYMRANDCNAKPVDVKKALLKRFVAEHGVSVRQIIGGFDDVPSIVQMYHEHDIPAIQLAVHDPRQAYAPKDL